MQHKRLFTILTILYIPIIILFFLIALINSYTGIPLIWFTRDMAAIADVNPFIGVVSNIGILLWCSATSICFFSFFYITYQRTVQVNDFTLFLLFFGIINLVLLIDDLFLFHEFVAPEILGISEEKVYAGYGAAVLFGIIRFRKVIFQTEWIVLGLSFGFFALSIAFDVLGNSFTLPNQDFIEDGFKLLGIANWVCYFVFACFQINQKRFKQIERKY